MVSITFQTTPPGARVFMDSADTLNITPVTLDIVEGSHIYMLRLNGYEDINGMVTIITGNNYVLEAIMKETSIQHTQALYKQMIGLGWASLVVASIGIIIRIKQKRGA